MLRRFIALGAPPLALLLATLLLIRYHPLILDILWGGRAPQAWREVLHRIPLMLAAVGMVAGLRMHSSGLLIVMASLGATAAVLIPAGLPGRALIPQDGSALTGLRLLLPAHYLLGYATLGHSWHSRRGLAVMTAAVASTGLLCCALVYDTDLEALLTRCMAPLADLPFSKALRGERWCSFLPALLTAGFLGLRAVGTHNPLAAGLCASLVVLLPALGSGWGPFPLVILVSASILTVLVGLLESMWALAYRDGLTGLPGRRALNQALGQLGRRCAIAMLDVDHFKRFNDRYGHRTGDDVLKMIAARMRRIPGGRPFRYGGEEFAVLFKGRAVRTAAERMEHFRATLAQTPFVLRHLPRADKKARGRKARRTSPRRQATITVSIGLAEADKTLRRAMDVLAEADKALYRAKSAGRNRVEARSAGSRRARRKAA